MRFWKCIDSSKALGQAKVCRSADMSLEVFKNLEYLFEIRQTMEVVKNGSFLFVHTFFYG